MHFRPYQETSEWRDVPGFEGLYCCNRAGLVKSCARVITRRDGVQKPVPERILQPVKHNRGYNVVTLCKDGKRHRWLVHRIIALTFVPNPNTLPCINHKNEDKTDNRAENLEWCTVRYNNTYGDRVQRIAAKKRGVKLSPETRRRMSDAHKNPPDETRQKLSAAAKGRRARDETRRKMSDVARKRKRGPDGRWCREVLPVSVSTNGH